MTDERNPETPEQRAQFLRTARPVHRAPWCQLHRTRHECGLEIVAGQVVPIDQRAQLARDNAASLPRLSDQAKLAERVNGGHVRYVAVIADMEGRNCEIGADYESVVIGEFRFSRDLMPELVAAISESAWQAGVHEHMRADAGPSPEAEAALDQLRAKLRGDHDGR